MLLTLKKIDLMLVSILGRGHVETWRRLTVKIVESATSTLETDVGDEMC